MQITLHNSTASSQYTRCLEINQAGMMNIVTATTSGCT
jgi:hypothetical protein